MYTNWCRLCGKDNGAEISIYSTTNLRDFDLKQLITKHFSIILNTEDKTPKKICLECYTFIEKLAKFIECVKIADKKFHEIINAHDLNDFQNPVKSEVLDESDLFGIPVELSPFEPDVHIKTDHEETTEVVELPNLLSNSASKEKQKTKSLCKPKNTMKNKNETNRINNENNSNQCFKKSEKPETQYEIYNTLGITNKKTLHSKNNERKTLKQEKQFECGICNSIFAFRHERKEHIKAIHNNVLQFECTICNKKFNRKKYLTKHMIVHMPDNKKYPCQYCDKKFARSTYMRTHIRTVHLGEKPFICDLCGKAFGLKGNLLEHLSTHETEQIYQCLKCDKKFKNKSGLRSHEDIHSDMIYTCPICKMQFNTRKNLTTHKLVHSKEKKHKCEHCGMAFKRLGHLKRHFTTHTGLAPFPCQYCDKTFTDNHNRRLHTNRVHSREISSKEVTMSE